MIGKYKQMKSMNPMSSLVVRPALVGRVFRILRNVGKIELRMITKASPPKYI